MAIQYFVSGHTAKGYVNYLDKNLQGIDKVIILQHDDERELTELFHQLAASYEKKEIIPEIISGLRNGEALAGVILREEGTAVLAAPIVQETIPDAIHLDLTAYYKQPPHTIDREKENAMLETAYSYYRKSLEIHDELETVYIQEMDFSKADQLAESFIDNLLRDVSRKEREPEVLERLFITNTPDGKVNHASSLIEPLEHVYYVKGRAGTGKSVFMKKVLHACEDYGFDVEVYRCSFDPDSVDMILVRELDFCIFDSTPPHELSPKDGKGTIIDLYEETVRPGTDERYAKEIEELTKKYKSEMKYGMEQLQQLKKVYGKPEKLQLEPAFKEVEKIINKKM